LLIKIKYIANSLSESYVNLDDVFHQNPGDVFDKDFQDFIKADTKTKVFQEESQYENRGNFNNTEEEEEDDDHLNNTQIDGQDERWRFINNTDTHIDPFVGDEDALGTIYNIEN